MKRYWFSKPYRKLDKRFGLPVNKLWQGWLLTMTVMRRSIRKFNIPPPGQPPGHLNFWRLAGSNSLPSGQKSRSNAPPITFTSGTRLRDLLSKFNFQVFLRIWTSSKAPRCFFHKIKYNRMISLIFITVFCSLPFFPSDFLTEQLKRLGEQTICNDFYFLYSYSTFQPILTLHLKRKSSIPIFLFIFLTQGCVFHIQHRNIKS